MTTRDKTQIQCNKSSPSVRLLLNDGGVDRVSPQNATKSERLVIESLKSQLKPGEVLLEQVRFTDSKYGDVEADVLLFIPGAGVAVIEIKGGIVQYQDGQWVTTDEGGYHRRIHPIEQARKAKHALRRYLDRQNTWNGGLIRAEWFAAFPFTQVDSDMGPEGRRELLIGKNDLGRELERIRAVLASPLNGDVTLTPELTELALNLINNPADKSVSIGESQVIGTRQANLVLLWLLMLGLSAFAGFWIDKLNLSPALYGLTFLVGLGGIWLSHRIRIIPNMRRKYISIGVAGLLLMAGTYGGSFLSGNPALNGSECNPNYFPCVPDDYPDLDCNEVEWRVDVTGTDVYNLDRDGDGIGCEWNPLFTPDETIDE